VVSSFLLDEKEMSKRQDKWNKSPDLARPACELLHRTILRHGALHLGERKAHLQP
jgi:hypothetical protein